MDCTEVEVTEAMTLAGLREIAGFSPNMDDPAEVVAAIYRAMARLRADALQQVEDRQ